MAKYVDTETGTVYEPAVPEVDAMFAANPRFKAVDEKPKAATRKRTAKKTTE